MWIAGDVAARLRAKFGIWRWDAWNGFTTVAGIDVVVGDLPEWLPAFHIGNTIIIRRGMDVVKTAWWVWHEVAHVVMHPGNWRFWSLLPWGELMLGKQERQANEFVVLFPSWEGVDD